MTWIEMCSVGALAAGAFFFVAGTIGLLRFPDSFTRLHAVTKADNLGLGLLVTGLILLAASWQAVLKLLAVWLLVLVASSSACHLIARTVLRSGVQPWRNS